MKEGGVEGTPSSGVRPGHGWLTELGCSFEEGREGETGMPGGAGHGHITRYRGVGGGGSGCSGRLEQCLPSPR